MFPSRRIALLLVPLVVAACQDITQLPDSGFRLSESPAEPAPGEVGEPTDAPSIASIAHQSHLGPGSLDITPASPTVVSNCIPFGNNTNFGFTGFIYRNVPAFNLLPGTQFAFDLGSQNDVDIRRNIFFATANKNPAPPVNQDPSQGIFAASGWTQVVSDNQVPQGDPRGNFVKDDYELVYTAEAPFSFPGGGLIVGFGASPPGAFADGGCEQVLVHTDNQDASGFFYRRFCFFPDQYAGFLDVPSPLPGGTCRGRFLGGIVIQQVISITVEMDIKPGSDPNCFNNDGNGVIPVAILGAADFDVTQVDPSTVQLEGLGVASKGKSGKLMAHVEDVNDDGFDDLVVQIEDVDGTFASGNGTATLTGNLYDGTPFEGSDDICVRPPDKGSEAPIIGELQPPSSSPLSVWNPDLGVDYGAGSPSSVDATRLCPSSDPIDCESLMFQAVDADPGVEDSSCGTECADDDFDGNLIDVLILDSPGDVYNGTSLLTNNAGLGPDMFQAFFCGDNFAPGNGGALCDGSDDGSYAVRILASDEAQPENNVATLDYSFVLDVTPPVVGFGGITGLNSSNAATVDFVLDAFVVDRNGDGTAVTSAVVQVTAITGGGGCFGGEDLITEAQVQVTPEGGNDDSTGNTVIADVTAEVQANSGDFDRLFTAANLGAGSVTYCFTLTADDGAERKDGTDDGTDVSSVAGKDFTWQ